MDLLDGPKDRFYPILTCLWLREGNGEVTVMIWARIVNQTIIGPFKVNEAIKLNSANYCDLKKTFFEWYKSQAHSFKMYFCTIMPLKSSHWMETQTTLTL